MTLSHKIVLSMCISFSLQAMEQEQKPLDEYTLIQNVCTKAWNTLDRYDPKNLESIDDVSVIISEFKYLKNQKIEAKEIGRFAYNQPIQKPDFGNMPDLKFYYAQDKPEWCAYYPYNKYRYVSFLIPLIGQYENIKDTNKNAFNILIAAITDMRDMNPEVINEFTQRIYDSVKL